jgi:hypothetical protein
MSNISVLSTGKGYSGVTLNLLNIPKTLYRYALLEPITVILFISALAIPFTRSAKQNIMLIAFVAASWSNYGLLFILGMPPASWYSSFPIIPLILAILYVLKNDNVFQKATWIKSVFVTLCVAGNIIVAISVISYRTDWIVRNELIIKEIQKMKVEKVNITGDKWDIKMLADKASLEAPEIEILDSSENESDYTISLLDYAERSALIIQNDDVVWEYRSLIYKSFISFFPSWSHPIFRRYYRIW